MKLPNFSNLTEKYKRLSNNLNLDEKFSKLSNMVEEKYTEISDSVDLDEKITKASNILGTLEEKCSKASDALGLDKKLMQLSNALDNFSEKYTDISGASKPEAFGPPNVSDSNSRTESTTPDLDSAFPNALNHHEDKCTSACKMHGSKERTKTPLNVPNSSGPAPSTKSVIPNINLTFPSTLPSCKEISGFGHKDPRILVYYMYYYDDGSSFSSKDFSVYFAEDAGNTQQVLEILKNKGWIQEKDPVSVLMTLYTVDELRTFLRVQGLKVSGRKEELVERLLEKVPFENFKHKYKHTLYSLTELGKKYPRAKKTDYDRAIITSTNAIKNQNFSEALGVYNSYDSRWGFLHANNKPHTIFAGYEIPSKHFNYIISHPMDELQNSNELKKDLRAFLLTALMRGKRDGARLQKEFMLINQEPIRCPNILDLYKQNEDGSASAEDLNRILDAMQYRIQNNPECVLGYYISNILYNSRRI